MKLTRNQSSWCLLGVMMMAYIGLFVVYFPRLAAIDDENGFINQAIVWSKGAMSAEGAGYTTLQDFQEIQGRHVPSRHPGRSLFALPFLMAFGLPGIFFSGMLLHLMMTIIGGLLLSRLGRSPLWAVLLLFHPTLALYSRTALADGASGMFLMLAAFATLSPQGRGIFSGIAVGLAALMRAHAGMALPIVAASLRYPPRGPKPWRDVASCLLAGIACGGLNMAYNLILYGSLVDPFSSQRGYFAAEFLVPHALFYAGCLTLIWPGMFLAPVFDRSPIRWLVRGVCGLNFVLFSFYYFHDDSPRFLETIVIGQRLIQVALPLWIISYVGMIDELVWARWESRLSRHTRMALIALGMLVLCMGTAVMFAQHQRHLERSKAERDAFAAIAPSGSLVVRYGNIQKLFGIPLDSKTYRFATLEFNGQTLDVSHEIAAESKVWYLVVLDSALGDSLPSSASDLIRREGLTEIPVAPPRLHVYISQGGARGKF